MKKPESTSSFRRVFRSVLDVILPLRCLSCGCITSSAGDEAAVCISCWPTMTWLADAPCCARCGHPWESPMPHDAWCGACLTSPPPFDRARAAVVYDEKSRPLVLGLKHADATYAAPALARFMDTAGRALLETADVIVPVPLHWQRLWRRQYNQAALLAQNLAHMRGVACDVLGLTRLKSTQSQEGLGRKERQKNVRKAFRVRDGRFSGKRVLLVDDVLTTGSTAQECCRALQEAGARAVDVLTLARVVHPQTMENSDEER